MRYFTLLLALAVDPHKPVTTPSNDPSGPRAALLMYDKLVQGPKDTEKALGLYQTTTTRDRALATALANCDTALANLRATATAKFDREVADAMLHVVYGTTTKDINEAQITVHGDTATVRYPDFPDAATMVRVDGEWKISVRAILNKPGSKPAAYRKALAQIAKSINGIAAKIEQGQYVHAEDASKALAEAQQAAFGR
jgi:hypothetical protein